MRYACTRVLKFAEEQRRDSAQKKKKNGDTVQFFFMILGLLVAQMVKETWVQPLGQEDPLEKGMATHSIDFLQ